MDIQQFLFPSGGASLNDIMTTAEAGIAAILLYRQKEKDTQIKNREEDIKELKEEIKLLKEELNHCYDKRAELADKRFK
jgi:hypothetical protein